MSEFDYATLEDGQLFELIFTAEDRLERKAALEIARRDGLAPYLAEVVGEKQNWLAELPEWWAVVHASYLLAQRGGEETVLPLLSALRWSDAFDCDWVTELLPAMLGRVGPPMLPGLTAVARDLSAGWSARDLAMKGLAAITLHHPESREHVFRIIGERFMDEGEERLVRQLAGHVLLDFRVHNYRLALLVFAREEEGRDEDQWLPAGFTPEEVGVDLQEPHPRGSGTYRRIGCASTIRPRSNGARSAGCASAWAPPPAPGSGCRPAAAGCCRFPTRARSPRAPNPPAATPRARAISHPGSPSPLGPSGGGVLSYLRLSLPRRRGKPWRGHSFGGQPA